MPTGRSRKELDVMVRYRELIHQGLGVNKASDAADWWLANSDELAGEPPFRLWHAVRLGRAPLWALDNLVALATSD